jgi:hypothetical protein
MAMSMMPLLIHSEAVSPRVRDALRAAHAAPPHVRAVELESAVRLLHHEAGLSCRDLRDLFDLGSKHEC